MKRIIKFLYNFILIKEDHNDEVYLTNKVNFLIDYLKDLDVLKHKLGDVEITTLFPNAPIILNVNNEILVNQNINYIESAILFDRYNKIRVIDFLKDNDGYILEDYMEYFNAFLESIRYINVAYWNSKNYNKYSYSDINSKYLHMYIINMVQILDTIYNAYQDQRRTL